MDTRFTKVIREAVDTWTKTFNPVGLSEKIERMFKQQVDEEVQRLTSELLTRAVQAEEASKREKAKNDGYESRIAALEADASAFKKEWLKRQAESKQRYDDLETRYSAVIRSAQVSR